MAPPHPLFGVRIHAAGGLVLRVPDDELLERLCTLAREGRQEGRREGREEGRREAELERWTERILTAETLEAVLRLG